jgi:hypothetical protein
VAGLYRYRFTGCVITDLLAVSSCFVEDCGLFYSVYANGAVDMDPVLKSQWVVYWLRITLD